MRQQCRNPIRQEKTKMSANSELMPAHAHVSHDNGYAEPVLIAQSSISRLYRVSKAGKHFILKTAGDDSERLRSLIRREYEISIGLDHPHIAGVFTFEDDTVVGPGIVMEYVDGRNLAEFLSENPPAGLRKRVAEQLMDAVGYLHRKGVIHNDLKPENVLISRSSDSVKLLDFGLSDTDTHYLARTMGCTAEYASPELLRQENVDARSDIYSLGLMLKDILGARYSRIIRKCTEPERDRRYENVDMLMNAVAHRHRPVYAVLSAVCLAVLLWTGVKAADEILEFKEFKAAEKERQELCDSVYAAIDHQIHSLYTSLEDRLESIPYIEFGFQEMAKAMGELPAIWESFQKATSDQQLISSFISYCTAAQQPYYEKITRQIESKPSYMDSGLSDEEIQFYTGLFAKEEPYRPFR